jgi:aspartate kinase
MEETNMIVMKFGGTSVNSKERLITMSNIVKKSISQQPVVVVSAPRGVTDLLLSFCVADKKDLQRILKNIVSIYQTIAEDFFTDVPQSFTDFLLETEKELLVLGTKRKTPALQDMIVAYGEIVSSHLIALALQSRNIPAVAISSTTCITTNNHFTNAEVLFNQTKEKTQKILLPLLAKDFIPIVTGFIGATENGQITTLGRGGSDYSASIIAACLDAEEIQFWKDVDGIYTADPNIVKNAQLLHTVSYKEVTRLLLQGSRVLHPRTIIPVSAAGIPLRVMNTLSPQKPGTLITHGRSMV